MTSSIPNADLREIENDLRRRERELRDAKEAQKALTWLEQYGEASVHDKDLSFEAHFAFARSCTGSTEAASYIERAADELRGDVMALAIKLASEDLARVLSGEQA